MAATQSLELPGPRAALERCVGDVPRFLEHHWAEEPLLRRHADPGAFADLLTLGDVDRILTTWGMRLPYLRVVKNGSQIPPSQVSRSVRVLTDELDDMVDPVRALEHFADGATLVLEALHLYWAPVTRLCRQLEEVLGHPADANAYITPTASRGLDVHVDRQDVFVMQLHGSKRWNLYRPVVKYPLTAGPVPLGTAGTAILEVTLEPGDLLYVPRGFPHAAVSLDATSAHLTVGITVKTWADVIREALRGALDSESFRGGLPAGFADDPGTLRGRLVGKLEELAGRLRTVDAHAVLESVADRARGARSPLVEGQLIQLAQLGRLHDGTRLRRRVGSSCKVTAASAGQVILHANGRRFRLPDSLGPALRRASARDELAVGDLDPSLDAPTRATLARQLIRLGVFEADGLHPGP